MIVLTMTQYLKAAKWIDIGVVVLALTAWAGIAQFRLARCQAKVNEMIAQAEAIRAEVSVRAAHETVAATERKDEAFEEQERILNERNKGIYGNEVHEGSLRDCFGDSWGVLTDSVRTGGDQNGDSTSVSPR